ncbi:MAG TPA: hypothetical protein VH136_02725 [Trebonia sp.]|jgi:hypothetical protein|nr:hypothetical protein [Trebonia sp.]
MTDIDPSADIELTSANEHVMARIPLAGQVTGEWLGCYHRLARAAAVPVRAETQPDRAWIVVTVPAASSHAEIAETLDAARALITEADTVARRAPPTAQAEASIRDWWSRLRKTPHHRPASRIEVVRTGIGAEKRWLLATALVLAMVVLLLLPSRFSVRLVTDLVEGGPETNSASDLLGVGFGSGCTRSSPSPSSTGCSTEAVLRHASGIRRNSRTWLFPSTSTQSLPAGLASGVRHPGLVIARAVNIFK